ncbi:MAG TPA: hypothetical protein VGX23_05645 [Actinocrinis sp.]|nr:hypothetical protein [Actinocrinis sp.]
MAAGARGVPDDAGVEDAVDGDLDAQVYELSAAAVRVPAWFVDRQPESGVPLHRAWQPGGVWIGGRWPNCTITSPSRDGGSNRAMNASSSASVTASASALVAMAGDEFFVDRRAHDTCGFQALGEGGLARAGQS